MFGRISKISPLAKRLLTKGFGQDNLPPSVCDPTSVDDPEWRTVQKPTERNRYVTVQKLVGFGDDESMKQIPLWRLRTTVQGKSVIPRFPSLVTDFDVREVWDDTVGSVEEIIPLDLAQADATYGGIPPNSKYNGGLSTKCGIGRCVTKPALGGLVSAREQMTICGVQEFGEKQGSKQGSIVWAFECDDRYHGGLWPEGSERETRAKTGIFSVAMLRLPESEDVAPNTFAVEYTLQLSIGGKLPPFAIGAVNAVVLSAVKTMFKYAKSQYFLPGGPADKFEEARERVEQQIEKKAAGIIV